MGRSQGSLPREDLAIGATDSRVLSGVQELPGSLRRSSEMGREGLVDSRPR